MEFLCQNPEIVAGGTVPPYLIVFKKGKYWKFDDNPTKGKPLGELVEGNIKISIKYPGMHLPGGVSHNGPALVIVYNTKWAQWKPTDPDVGKSNAVDIIDTPISDERAKEPEGDLKDIGALIIVDKIKFRYAKIMDEKVCHVIIKGEKCYWDGQCKPVTEDENQFPPNIVAAALTRTKIWYFFDREGKHCKREDGVFTPVNKFLSLNDYF